LSYTSHYSVLKDECLEFLVQEDNKNPYYADLTFGGGGHSFALLESNQSARVLSVDQDPEAYSNGIQIIKKNGFSDRIQILPTNFINFPIEFRKLNLGIEGFDGILMDLGVSSHHFDSIERGFSFRANARLDMRMNTNSSDDTAEDIINDLDEKELADIFYQYGEERYSRRIAARIIEERKSKRITQTSELENIVFHSYPKPKRHGRPHPATRVFQALRIYVNKELLVLEEVIPQLIPLLNPGGRLAIITFHSLEDRIVKHSFKNIAGEYNNIRILTKKPIIPTEEEIHHNFRSRSAKLRVIEKKA
jgi:16S rRNA (cytosine1402-N4)-methyltransferase